MDVDSALQIIGSCGRIQTINILIFGISLTVASFQNQIIAFTLDQSVAHYCKPPPGFTTNETTVYVQRNGRGVRDSCHMYGVFNGTLADNVTTCEDGWDYSNQNGATNVITELDLVCSQSHLGGTLMLVHFLGLFTGCYVTGQAADTYGRRRVCIVTLVCTAVLGASLSFVWNMPLMLVLRFLLGMAIPGNTLVGLIRGVEMFPPKRRVFGFICIQSFWSLGLILVAPMAYLLPQWRNLQLASSLLCLPPLPFHWFFSYESIRWLAQNGHVDRAESILKRIAESKNIAHNGGFLQSETTESDQPAEAYGMLTTDDAANEKKSVQGERTVATVKKYTFLDLFRTRVLIKYSLLMFFCWFALSALYFGLLIYSTILVGNKYLNFLLLALIEIPAFAAEYVTINRFGRRKPLICLLFATAAVFVVSGFLPTKTAGGTDLTALVIAVTVMGKFFGTSAYHVTILTGAEVFPTVLRNIATGSCGTVGKIGTLIVPFIVLLKEEANFLPMTIFGTLSLLASICVFLLPETKNRPLPETFDDARKLAHNKESAV